MSDYHLQARRCLRGGGSRREQTRLLDVEALGDAERAALDLARDGYTVWIFRKTAGPALTATTHRLRLVRTISPHAPDPPEPSDSPAHRPRRADGGPVGPSAAERAGRAR